VEVRDELRPRVEAAFPGDGQLGIGQLERARGVCNVRADGLQAAESGQIAVAGRANQLLGELALLFEVNGNGHGRPPSKSPVSASWAEERSLLWGNRYDRGAPPFPRTGGVL
jgi:hypothetical protein